MLSDQGTPLTFVAPMVKDGILVTRLDKKELQVMSQLWQFAAVFYIVGARPSKESLHTFILLTWSSIGRPQIFFHREGYFVVKFRTQDEYNEVMNTRALVMGKRPVLIRQWVENFDFHQEILRVIPIWLRFPNLPLNCWSADSLIQMGSVIGTPLYVDECTTKQS